MYYAMDAIMAVLLLIILVMVQVTPSEESKQSLPRVMKRVSSPIFALFILNIGIFGTLYALVQYYTIFAQRELGASSKIIGMCFV